RSYKYEVIMMELGNLETGTGFKILDKYGKIIAKVRIFGKDAKKLKRLELKLSESAELITYDELLDYKERIKASIGRIEKVE
ncbi:MAG: hypothetical protein ACREBJ_08300, partial [Nitrosotalea sp.]